MPSIGGGETAACFACTPHGSDNSGRAYRDKRKTLWALDRFDAEIDIEIGPVEMPRSCLLDVENFPDRRVFEESR